MLRNIIGIIAINIKRKMAELDGNDYTMLIIGALVLYGLIWALKSALGT